MKRRVLLIAYQCAPEGGSVAMIGYRWFHYLRQRCDLHLITHIRHKHELEDHLEQRDTVSYIDTEWFAAPLYKLAQKLLGGSQHALFMVANLDFLLFGRQARKLGQTLHSANAFDVVHAPTPVTPVAPHQFGKIGAPCIVGPLNGGMPPLTGFPEISSEEKAWLYPLRKLARVFTGIWGTFRHADLILSATRQNDKDLGPKFNAKIRAMCENGVDAVADAVPPFPPLPPKGKLRLLFVGRIIPVKGLRMVLDAIADLPNIDLTIVGKGPEEDFLRDRVKALNLQDRVHFMGFKKQADLPAIYRDCHLNILTSVRESGGATILEAMAQGRPSIGLNNGGPTEYITPESGFLIECGNTQQVTMDLQILLETLLQDASSLQQLGEGALTRARNTFTWSAKINAALDMYDELSNRCGG